MKQISKSIRKDFKMPLIYLDDLEAIEEVLKGNSVRDFKIKTSDFEYDSVSEINSNQKHTNELSISARDPYISVDFNKYSTYLYASESETKTVGIVTKIAEIIKKRERKLRWFSAKISVWLAGPLFVIAFGILVKVREKGVEEVRWIGPVILALIIIWWALDYRHSLHLFSDIAFIRRDEQKSFFVRKKDEIILVIITVILTSVLTIIAQQLFK